MAGGQEINEYGILAPYYDGVYNAILGNRRLEIEAVKGVAEVYCPEARSLLDIGTGTGAILRGFKGIISELVGLDISPDMLAVAQRDVPEASFVEADMSKFDLGRKFDVELCVFQPINHLKHFEQWRSLFESAANHLNPGGVFIFDMITTGFMQRLVAFGEPDTWVFDGGHYSIGIEKVRESDYVTTFAVEAEDASGLPINIKGNLHQTVFPMDQVTTAAEEYFVPELAFDLAAGVLAGGRLQAATDDSSRPLFVYSKR